MVDCYCNTNTVPDRNVKKSYFIKILYIVQMTISNGPLLYNFQSTLPWAMVHDIRENIITVMDHY